MSQLTNNTASLEAILAAVNSLPVAGDGGGQSASGTIKGSASNTLTVSGLGFTPTHVFVIATNRFNNYLTIYAAHVTPTANMCLGESDSGKYYQLSGYNMGDGSFSLVVPSGSWSANVTYAWHALA